VAAPTLPNIRGTNGGTCPTNGGDGAFVCQDQGAVTNGSYTGTAHSLNSTHKGWYFDMPVANSRVIIHPQPTSGGALVFTINVPTNQTCDPGGSSSFVNVDAGNGGAIPTEFGATTYYPTISFLDYALASRAMVVTGAAGGHHRAHRMAAGLLARTDVREKPRASRAAGRHTNTGSGSSCTPKRAATSAWMALASATMSRPLAPPLLTSTSACFG
jgi:type IV pilus assembly protein PilY1